VVLLAGDLALIHDVGALQAAQRHALALSVVVFDNGGGGIFSYLPIAQRIEHESFETHFRTPHAGDLGAIARGFGAESERVRSWEHLRAAFKASLASPGLSVVEVPVDRDRSVAQHRELDRRISGALARVVARP
jgi:2-succinyl-5-enolpyruvyl-6-hydroxy-3-cyclohexene-1-carboxylate synthase